MNFRKKLAFLFSISNFFAKFLHFFRKIFEFLVLQKFCDFSFSLQTLDLTNITSKNANPMDFFLPHCIFVCLSYCLKVMAHEQSFSDLYSFQVSYIYCLILKYSTSLGFRFSFDRCPRLFDLLLPCSTFVLLLPFFN